MQITASAQERLHELERRFRHGERGFHFGKIGGCHGAIARFRPGRDPRPGEREFEVDGVTLFMRPDEFHQMQAYTLDYRKGPFFRRFRLDADCNVCEALRLC